jgi:hypothetical protein
LLQHGDGVGLRGQEGWVSVEEFAEEDLGVGEGAAGGGVGGDDADCAEGVGEFNDELDGTDLVEGGDGATWDDGERGREGSDGDEAEIGAGGEKLVGAERGLGVVEAIAFGECGGEGWVLEVPHEGSRIEEVDGGDAEHSMA